MNAVFLSQAGVFRGTSVVIAGSTLAVSAFVPPGESFANFFSRPPQLCISHVSLTGNTANSSGIYIPDPVEQLH